MESICELIGSRNSVPKRSWGFGKGILHPKRYLGPTQNGSVHGRPSQRHESTLRGAAGGGLLKEALIQVKDL